MSSQTPIMSPVIIQPTQLNSLEEARAVFGFTLQVPQSVPSGFKLAKIQRVHSDLFSADVIILRYERQQGGTLIAEQGFPVAYDNAVYRFSPNVPTVKGSTSVQGKPALWMRGYVMGSGQGRQPTWVDGPLSVRWKTGPYGEHGAYTAYALESPDLALEELLTVANSVGPG
jgi:hypothetical protein